jgi:hypothetical protein
MENWVMVDEQSAISLKGAGKRRKRDSSVNDWWNAMDAGTKRLLNYPSLVLRG